jgi:hypothetical protein
VLSASKSGLLPDLAVDHHCPRVTHKHLTHCACTARPTGWQCPSDRCRGSGGMPWVGGPVVHAAAAAGGNAPTPILSFSEVPGCWHHLPLCSATYIVDIALLWTWMSGMPGGRGVGDWRGLCCMRFQLMTV